MRPLVHWIAGMTAAALLTGCESQRKAVGRTGSDGSVTDASGGSSIVVGGQGGTTQGGTPQGGAGGTSSSTDVCSGKGPVVTIAGTTGTPYQTCTGRIAETRFINALCTCEDTTVLGYLRTRAFNSNKGTTPDLGGTVGINRLYTVSAGYTDVGGSLAIAGADSMSLAGYVKTGGDFRTQGTITVPGYTSIGRNMWLGGGYTDIGPVTVAGDLHASGSVLAIPLSVGGARYTEPVTIPPPCPCKAEDILDVAALVAEAKLHNDNAKNGIDPTMFDALVGEVRTTLPCGKFYLEAIAGLGSIIFEVTGRVALFIDGSVSNLGNLEFRLTSDAEIDIFIRGDLALGGRAIFGEKERPAGSRIYLGGSGDVTLAGDAEFVGNLYAPRSIVRAVGYANVWGSIFARNFVSPGYATFAYDAAITTAGSPCDNPPPPPGTCSQCGTCTGGTACVDGNCGACRSDVDCCGQLICSGGKCIEPGVIY